MDNATFEILKVVVTLAVMIGVYFLERYVAPFIKSKMDDATFEAAKKWVTVAVQSAQQVLLQKTGQERKAYVTEFLRGILEAKNISLTDEQLDVLIEAAVKEMKMIENQAQIGG